MARLAVVRLGSRDAADLGPIDLGEPAGDWRTAYASRESLDSQWSGHQRTQPLTLTSHGVSVSPGGGGELCTLYSTPMVPPPGNDPASFVGASHDDDEHGGDGRLYRGYDHLWLGDRYVGNFRQSHHDWAGASWHRRGHQRLYAATVGMSLHALSFEW